MKTVPIEDERDRLAQAQRANARLQDSLNRCQQILADCRSKLASVTLEASNDDEVVNPEAMAD